MKRLPGLRYVGYVYAFSCVLWVLSLVRRQPLRRRSVLCVSAVATAVVNAARSAASQETHQSRSHNTSSPGCSARSRTPARTWTLVMKEEDMLL